MVQLLASIGAAAAAASLFAFSIAEDTAHTYPLFPYEVNALTANKLQSLIEANNATESAHLFAFDSGTDLIPDRLKSGTCKVFPGDTQWPSQPAWTTFNRLLGGYLIKTVPLAAPCYQNLGVYDAAKCEAIRAAFSTSSLHQNDPTSIFWPQFQGRTCMPTTEPASSNCTQGGFPVYAVNVSNVGQIQLAVNYARNTHLRLVIKNTGHCYLGKSSGAGALSIWTHNLKDLVYYPDLKVPGYSGPALKVGAGVTVREVYAEAHKNGVSALGGICESVGYAGGYVAGGGHTPLSGFYGMAADHVLALEVVTADGRYITASPEENTDLYWALRGGGGGTFGVVTSVIIRVHPKIPVTTSTFSFSTSDNYTADVFWKGLRAYFELFIPFTDAGTYTFFNINNTNGVYTFRMNPFFAPNHTVESFNALVKPWFDRLTELGIPFTPNTTYHDAFYPAYNYTWGSNVILNAAARMNIPGNWLLPRGNWEDPAKFNATFNAIREHTEEGRVFVGYHQAPRNRAHVDNSVNPAWRQTLSFLILSGRLPVGVSNPTAAHIRAASDELINHVLPRFRAVAPESEGGGSYMNEAAVDEPNWQLPFYGAHYPRLLELKQKYDPKHVFYGTTAVGSEGWEVRDDDYGTQTQNGRLCRR